jgi:hypothetical protein
MQAILDGIVSALGAVMDFCYSIVKNYGLAIILFTLISKIILLPISICALQRHQNGSDDAEDQLAARKPLRRPGRHRRRPGEAL